MTLSHAEIALPRRLSTRISVYLYNNNNNTHSRRRNKKIPLSRSVALYDGLDALAKPEMFNNNPSPENIDSGGRRRGGGVECLQVCTQEWAALTW